MEYRAAPRGKYAHKGFERALTRGTNGRPLNLLKSTRNVAWLSANVTIAMVSPILIKVPGCKENAARVSLEKDTFANITGE